MALRCVARCPGPRSRENRAPGVPRPAGGLVCLGRARFLPAVLGGQPVERRVHSAGSRVPALSLFFLELDCVVFSLTGNSRGRICRLPHARCGGFQDSHWAQRPTPCLTSGRCRHPRKQRRASPSPTSPGRRRLVSASVGLPGGLSPYDVMRIGLLSRSVAKSQRCRVNGPHRAPCHQLRVGCFQAI